MIDTLGQIPTFLTPGNPSDFEHLLPQPKHEWSQGSFNGVTTSRIWQSNHTLSVHMYKGRLGIIWRKTVTNHLVTTWHMIYLFFYPLTMITPAPDNTFLRDKNSKCWQTCSLLPSAYCKHIPVLSLHDPKPTAVIGKIPINVNWLRICLLGNSGRSMPCNTARRYVLTEAALYK